MKYEEIDQANKAFFNIAPRANLKPLPASEIHVKVAPEPIICIWLPRLMFQEKYAEVVQSMKRKLEKSGWIPLVFASEESEVKVVAFTVDNAKRLDIEKLKEQITKEIKGE